MNTQHEYGFESQQPKREPKFSIEKAPLDPETLAIFDARRNCFAEPRGRLDRAKYMFAELCDRATKIGGDGFVRKGSVIVPDLAFARLFGVWSSTISTWKKQLIACGYIWISKRPRSDRWPITVYHLACIHERPNHATQNPDGTSNYGGSRAAPGKPGEPTGNFDPKTGKPKFWSHGARKPGQKSLPLATPHVTPVPWNNPPREPLKLKNKAILKAITDFDWASATAGTGCQPVPTPAVSHNGHRLSAGAERGAQPVSNGADSQQKDGATAGAGQTLKRVSVRSVEKLKEGGEGEAPPDVEFVDWKKGLKGLFPSRLNAMHGELKAKLGLERDPDRRAFYKRRLEAIDEVRLGGKPPKASEPKASPVRVLPPAKEEVLSAEERALKEKFDRRLKVKVAA